MDILNSAWFLRMLKKAGATPRERLLAVFDILGDWLDAPHMRENFAEVEAGAEPQALLEYLAAQAEAGGVPQSETLAQQLYFLSISMLREEFRAPGCAASQHAKQVAQALIQAQTEKERFITKRAAYAIAASVFVVTGMGSLLAYNFIQPFTSEQKATISLASSNPTINHIHAFEARPEQTAALFATIEQMRKGECQFPEVLQLPDAYKGIYLTNVVEGQISTDIADQQLVLQLLEKVRCNYTPMLMKNSAG